MKEFLPITFDTTLQRFVVQDNDYRSNVTELVAEINTASTVWNITHNYNSTDIITTVFVDSKVVTPLKCQTIDNNTIEITFASPVKGKALMLVMFEPPQF